MSTAKRTYETFGEPHIAHALEPVPRCFNGMAYVRRYRITVELIEEPLSVLQARINDLWETSDNSHDMSALKAAAKETGVAITGQWAKRRAKVKQ